MDISLPLCINRLVCTYFNYLKCEVTYFSEENLIRVMNKKNINLLYEKWKNKENDIKIYKDIIFFLNFSMLLEWLLV